MNAVFYGFQFPHHGRFSAFSALSREFEQQGVQVCRMPFPNIPEWLPGRVKGGSANKWYQLNEYRLYSAFKKGSLVHYFFPENSLFKGSLWKKSGPLVLSCHQPIEELRASSWMRRRTGFFEGLKAADAIVLMASCEMDAYRELAPNVEVLCIPHGVDTAFFSPPEGGRTPQDEKFRVLTVGNWLRDYELWAQVVERVVSVKPNIEFSVLANPDRLTMATGNLKSGRDHIRLLCGISDEQLRDEYCRADIVFLPLKDAWANNALLESMSCGRPLLVTDLPATREYAGDAACFIEKSDVDAAIQYLLQLSSDISRCKALGQAARHRMVSHFSWGKITQTYMKLYVDFLS